MWRVVISSEEWAVLEQLLPVPGGAGHHRDLLGQALHQRFTRWAADGTWARLKAEVVALTELDEDNDWRPRPATHATGLGDRRQGLFVAGEPAGAARQRNPRNDPGTQRPARLPETPRLGPPAFDPGRLPPPQPTRTRLHPAQTLARCGHQVR
jgi:hypothetical protein